MVGPTVALMLLISTPKVRSTSTIRFLLEFYSNKVKFTVNKGAEQTDTNEYEDEEAETLVFDDPAKQEVIFDDNGGAVVIDEGYQNEDINIKEGPMPKPVKPEPKQPEASGSEIEMVVEEAKGDTETANAKTVADAVESNEPYDPKRDLEHYKYPTLDLLKKYDNDGKPYIDMAEQNANKNRIVDVLRTFGVEISSIKGVEFYSKRCYRRYAGYELQRVLPADADGLYIYQG